MAPCVSVFADNSLLVLKYMTLLYYIVNSMYIITVFVYRYIIGHVPTIYYHPTM